jgi:hypothetical protein
MKKSVLFIMLCSYISGYESTATSPTLITFKLESSEILTDSQGQNSVEPNNSIKVFPKIFKKDSLVQDKIYKLRQIDDNTFEVLGSPLSRAIEENND